MTKLLLAAINAQGKFAAALICHLTRLTFFPYQTTSLPFAVENIIFALIHPRTRLLPDYIMKWYFDVGWQERSKCECILMSHETMWRSSKSNWTVAMWPWIFHEKRKKKREIDRMEKCLCGWKSEIRKLLTFFIQYLKRRNRRVVKRLKENLKTNSTNIQHGSHVKLKSPRDFQSW